MELEVPSILPVHVAENLKQAMGTETNSYTVLIFSLDSKGHIIASYSVEAWTLSQSIDNFWLLDSFTVSCYSYNLPVFLFSYRFFLTE